MTKLINHFSSLFFFFFFHVKDYSIVSFPCLINFQIEDSKVKNKTKGTRNTWRVFCNNYGSLAIVIHQRNNLVSFDHEDFYFHYKDFSHILYLDFHFLNLMLERQLEVQQKGNAEWAGDRKRTFISFSCLQWWCFPFPVGKNAVCHWQGAPGTD